MTVTIMLCRSFFLKRTVFSNIANKFLSAKSVHGGRNIS